MTLGIRYRFKLRDLPKYSATLRLTGNNLKYSALGKLIPNPKERKKILIKGSHFNTLLKLLKATDWSQTPVYHQFLRNRRWKHEDESVYSEIELRYNISYINKLRNIENIKELNKTDTLQIIEEFKEKTFYTLEILMNQCNMMYYWEKIRFEFLDEDPNLDQLEKLMSRCLKQYSLIDSFINIFKLIHKIDVSSPVFADLCSIEAGGQGTERRNAGQATASVHQRAAQGESCHPQF